MFSIYIFISSFCFFFYVYGHHRDLHVLTPSFPTRRSSDLHESSVRFGSQFKSPLAPLIITSRASAAVSATRAIRQPGFFSAISRIHSEPIRVLPNPRPARTSQVVQSPSGASWSSRAQNGQCHLSFAFSASVRDFSHSCLRSEEHTSELQSLMRISYAVFCLKKKKTNRKPDTTKS